MVNDLTILRNGALPSTAFKDANLPKTRLDEGTAGSPFARVSYKAGKWAVKFQGKFDPASRIVDGRREQNPNLDIVILKAANHPSKAWYEAAYNPEAEQTGPDCYSSLGMKPDLPGSRKPQHDTCLLCPHNAWGSKVDRTTGEARKGKDCMDFKKLAVVPVGDIENKIYGGPMLLQIPASSLRNLGPYQNLLEANGFHYAQVHTRVTFSGDEDISYPLMEFDALAALDDVQVTLGEGAQPPAGQPDLGRRGAGGRRRGGEPPRPRCTRSVRPPRSSPKGRAEACKGCRSRARAGAEPRRAGDRGPQGPAGRRREGCRARAGTHPTRRGDRRAASQAGGAGKQGEGRPPARRDQPHPRGCPHQHGQREAGRARAARAGQVRRPQLVDGADPIARINKTISNAKALI